MYSGFHAPPKGPVTHQKEKVDAMEIASGYLSNNCLCPVSIKLHIHIATAFLVCNNFPSPSLLKWSLSKIFSCDSTEIEVM
jgi:hypothetical protein